MSAIDHLIRLSADYAQATGVETTTVSWRLFGDSKKLGAIIEGADIQVRRLERAIQWLSDQWPPGTEWPAGVVRPPARSDEGTEAA